VRQKATFFLHGKAVAFFIWCSMERPKLCYIEWLDINTHDGPWVKLPDHNVPSLCFTLGWLIHEEISHVIISATYSDEDEERSALITTAIPRGCITKIEELDLEKLRG
jgi:hypothetical protein